MPEHRIRFRGGWELDDASSQPGPARRLTLPTRWPTGLVGSIRLTRRFGRPPIDPLTESAWLEFRDVPGLQRVSLNGNDLGSPPGGSDWTIELGKTLEARNTLTLELSPSDSPEAWGSIALVIASKGERPA